MIKHLVAIIPISNNNPHSLDFCPPLLTARTLQKQPRRFQELGNTTIIFQIKISDAVCEFLKKKTINIFSSITLKALEVVKCNSKLIQCCKNTLNISSEDEATAHQSRSQYYILVSTKIIGTYILPSTKTNSLSFLIFSYAMIHLCFNEIIYSKS